MSDGGISGAGNSPTKIKASGTWGVNEVHDARLKDLWPVMPPATQFYVGSFVKPSSTTGNQAITGVGFTPKAIIFWTSGSEDASGTWSTHIFQSLGFATASTAYGVGGQSIDNVSTADTARRMAANAIVLPTQDGSGTAWAANLASMDADGFTLNWVTNVAQSQTICFLAIGGEIQAEVLKWNFGTTTGNLAISTGTFQPDLVLHMTSGATTVPQSTADHVIGFGATNSVGEQWSISVSAADGGSPNTTRWQRSDSCLLLPGSNEVQNFRASHVSMDANGFTINRNTNIFTTGREVASLCIKGVQSKLGAFNKTTSVAPVSQAVTGVGFTSGAMLTANSLTTSAQTSPLNHGLCGIGATDGTNDRATAQVDMDVATSDAESVFRSDACITSGHRPASTIQTAYAAGLTSFDADGFTLNWTNNTDVGAYQILYMALA